MANATATQTKFLSLLKQTLAVELDIVDSEQDSDDVKILRALSEQQDIALNTAHGNSYQRALKRQQMLQSRQQMNLEQILSMALEKINPDSALDRIELDWFMKFSQLAENVFSPNMQELWAQILAIELEYSGSFSIRSLQALAEISQKEARIFYKAVKLLCRIGDDRQEKILTGMYRKPSLLSIFTQKSKLSLNLAKFGLNYSNILTLAELKLLQAHEIESAPFRTNDVVTISYGSENVRFKVHVNDVVFTYYKLTQTGYELAKLVNQEKLSQFIQQLAGEFEQLITIQG